MDEFLPLLIAHRDRCLKDEPGTLRFDVLRPRDDENVLLYQEYADDAAFQVHWNGPHLARMRAETTGMVAKLTGIRCSLLDQCGATGGRRDHVIPETAFVSLLRVRSGERGAIAPQAFAALKRIRMMIGDLGDHVAWLPLLARWHYDQWGPLTGADSLDEYVTLLTEGAARRTVPSILVAVSDGELLGSATLVASDLPVRPEMTPWLAQLFVEPGRRRDGVGAALVHAVLRRARQCGYRRVYLYTSGTLPQYYSRLGWRFVERLEYLGRERTVMGYDIG